MPIARSLNQAFFENWSPEMAYVLGFFAADGAMIRNNRGAHFIEFHNTDRVILERIRQALGSNHRISARTRPAPWKTAYRLQVGSKEWFSKLEGLGFTQNKSLTLRMPSVPKEYFGDFVRGYFDGDGCIHLGKYRSGGTKKRWVCTTRFTCGNRAFLEELHRLLWRRGGLKGGYISAKIRGFELVFSHYDSLALHDLMYHTAHTSSLYLPRKRSRLERAIKVLKMRE
jgi:hypothetical protein